VNYEVGKKALGAIVNDLAERYTKVEVAASLDALKDTGFHWATRSGVTVSIDDVTTPADKAEILASYETQAAKVQTQFERVWSPTTSVARSSSRSGPRRPTRSAKAMEATSTGPTRST
jgi:DNA-directed RNA polymerase beta' subunit